MLILRLAGLVDKKPAIPILGSLAIRSILGSARYRARSERTRLSICRNDVITSEFGSERMGERELGQTKQRPTNKKMWERKREGR